MGAMQLIRPPASPRLRAFVQTVWASQPAPEALPRAGAREHVLPTGAMHLVFRLSGPPLRVYADSADAMGSSVGHAIVGGARSRFYVRDVSTPTRSVGALLRPGAARVLFGAPEDVLAGRHTPLDALWGARAGDALARLHDAPSPGLQLALLEQLLLEQLGACIHGMHPAVAQALAPLAAGGTPVSTLAARSGLSHRRFIDLVRGATGLAPKEFARVQRLGQVLALAADPTRDWAEVAVDAGFFDQAHLTREFGAMAGLSPQAWRRAAAPATPRHVPR